MIALVTAFDPFDENSLNSSAAALDALPNEIAGIEIAKAVLPTSFARAWPALESTLEGHNPDLILMLGQAGGRSGLSLERQAVNRIEARIPDNDGAQPAQKVVLAEILQERYETTLPLPRILDVLCEAGIEAYLSDDAGGFVCNATLFRLLHHLAGKKPLTLAGFIHLPWLPGQTSALEDQPTLSAEAAAWGIGRVIRACAEEHSAQMRDSQDRAGDASIETASVSAEPKA